MFNVHTYSSLPSLAIYVSISILAIYVSISILAIFLSISVYQNPTLPAKVMRANYGRFSLTVCNPAGVTDWSVNCMARRSLRIVQDR